MYRSKTNFFTTIGIHLFWNNHANNLEYCNKKIDHIVNTVVDKVILLTGAATGL